MSNIRQWLEELILDQYADAFEENDIGVALIPSLDHDVLKDIGVSIAGHRLKILNAAKHQSDTFSQPAREAVQETSPGRIQEKSQVPGEAERRQLTVMFCDLVGSTSLSERLDPEDLRVLMAAYRKAAADVVARYDGHVAQYLGDGVMAYFGWPRAHEDDGERAVRAALDIVAAVKRVDAADPLQLRVGIATGPVVVGEGMDDDAEANKLAVGETPNLAARLQGQAGADEIVIAQGTHDLIRGAFDYDDLGAQNLKGIQDLVHAWRVKGASQAEGRFEAQSVGGLTSFVGRETEIAMLLDRWAQAKDGEGQVVLLEGEPGIGKSRLTQVLRERLADQPHIRLRYQCSPYYANSAFYPIIDQMERAAGFAREDSNDAKLDKLETVLAQSAEDVSIVAPLISAMLSLPIDRYPPLNLSPQRQKDDIIAALAAQVIALSEQQPLLMLFEDAHWCDPTTLETMTAVIGQIEAAPVLLVITYRPEFDPPWTGHGHVVAQSLSRLGKRQGADLVARVTGGKALPDEVLEQIIAKTDGIPLFVEELTKTVLEAGYLKDTGNHYELDGPLPPLAIPSTLQDSLMARLDRLSPVKEVAQTGACIGREFSYELLAAVSPLRDNELQDALQQLVNSELIFRRGSPPESIYSFKHALVQDSAYETLLRSRRQQLHQTIASVLREQFAEQVRTEPALLARHLTEAGLYEKAIPTWHQAGQAAFLASSYAEAIANIKTALDLLQHIDNEAKCGQMEVGLQTLLGLSYQNSVGFGAPETGKAMARAGELLDHAGSMAEKVSILSVTAGNHWLAGDVSAAAMYYERAFEVAKESEDADLVTLSKGLYGAILLHVGRGLEGARLISEMLAAYDRSRHRDLAIQLLGMDIEASVLVWFGWTLTQLGDFDQAREVAKRGVDVAKAGGHPFTIAQTLSIAALTYNLMGDYKSGFATADEGVKFSEEQGILFWLAISLLVRGFARGRDNDLENGLHDMERGRGLAADVGSTYTVVWSYAATAELLMLTNRFDDADQYLQLDIQKIELAVGTEAVPNFLRLKADLEVARHGVDSQGAESSLRQGLEISRETRYRYNELRTAISLARFWQVRGDIDEARDLLTGVLAGFNEGLDTEYMKEAQSVLASLR
jgi:class 3 adenylate cyclase/tetratricopeptide (TPR) repeat protein